MARPRLEKDKIEVALSHLAENMDSNYMAAAILSGLSVSQIRGRILNDYGTLTIMRLEYADGHAEPEPLTVRRCMICKESYEMEKNQRICERCNEKNARIHEGSV